MEGQQGALEPSNTAVEKIAVCAGKDQRGIQALKWALGKIVRPQGHVYLLHVTPPLRWIPNPLGGKLPVGQVNPAIVKSVAADRFSDTQKLLSDFAVLCKRSKVTCEICCVENDSIQKEIVDQISKQGITKLVLEISSLNALTKALKKESISAYVAKHAPEFCSVLIIRRGKLFSVRDASISDLGSISMSSATSISSGKSMEDLQADNDLTTSTGLSSSDEGMLPPLASRTSPLNRLPQSASMDVTRASSDWLTPHGKDNGWFPSAVSEVMVRNRPAPPSLRLSGFAPSTLLNQESSRVDIRQEKADHDKRLSLIGLDSHTATENSSLEDPGRLATSFAVSGSRDETIDRCDCDAISQPGGEMETSTASSTLEALSSRTSLSEMDISQVDTNPEPTNESRKLELPLGQLNEAKQSTQNDAKRQAKDCRMVEDMVEDPRRKISEYERNRDIAMNESRIAAHRASYYQNELERAFLQEAIREQESLQERLLAEEKKRAAMQNDLETARTLANTATMRADMAEQELQSERRKCREVSSKLEEVTKQLEKECRLRKEAEERLRKEVEEKLSLGTIMGLGKGRQKCPKYSFKELQIATNDFHDANKLGQGGYGPVYKGNLYHIPVAIKVLAREGSQGRDEFKKEVELLSGLRHPHLVTLIGACPEKACIVYQYMANGSLDDRLQCRGGSPPLPWYVRFRICREIATALLYLQSLPQPVVHCDLKPGNVLLDDQFVSKISDVGLAKLAADNLTFSLTMYHDTVLVGTFAYMDPDYQRTGVVSCESDVYSFGIIMMQLLTGRPAMGLAHVIEQVVDNGKLSDILDKSAGDWPFQEAMVLARLSLQCTEPKRKHRPKLETELLPELERIQAPFFSPRLHNPIQALWDLKDSRIPANGR